VLSRYPISPCRNHGRPIIKHTTEIEYEGIEPSSTPHVLDARFSQANVFYGGPGGSRTRVQNALLYNFVHSRTTTILYMKTCIKTNITIKTATMN